MNTRAYAAVTWLLQFWQVGMVGGTADRSAGTLCHLNGVVLKLRQTLVIQFAWGDLPGMAFGGLHRIFGESAGSGNM